MNTRCGGRKTFKQTLQRIKKEIKDSYMLDTRQLLNETQRVVANTVANTEWLIVMKYHSVRTQLQKKTFRSKNPVHTPITYDGFLETHVNGVCDWFFRNTISVVNFPMSMSHCMSNHKVCSYWHGCRQ